MTSSRSAGSSRQGRRGERPGKACLARKVRGVRPIRQAGLPSLLSYRTGRQQFTASIASFGFSARAMSEERPLRGFGRGGTTQGQRPAHSRTFTCRQVASPGSGSSDEYVYCKVLELQPHRPGALHSASSCKVSSYPAPVLQTAARQPGPATSLPSTDLALLAHEGVLPSLVPGVPSLVLPSLVPRVPGVRREDLHGE